MNVFNWRLWLSEDFESEEFGVILKTWYSCEDYEAWRLFVFVVSFSLSWVIRNTVLLKGVEVKLRKSFQVMLISKTYTYQSFRVKPLEISYGSVNFSSDRDEDILVSEEFVLTKELGIRKCGLPTSEEHDSPEEFDSQISDRCCAMRQLSQNIYPPTTAGCC